MSITSEPRLVKVAQCLDEARRGRLTDCRWAPFALTRRRIIARRLASMRRFDVYSPELRVGLFSHFSTHARVVLRRASGPLFTVARGGFVFAVSAFAGQQNPELRPPHLATTRSAAPPAHLPPIIWGRQRSGGKKSFIFQHLMGLFLHFHFFAGPSKMTAAPNRAPRHPV